MEESSESLPPEPKVLPQRSTRGQRITTLVGTAKEVDDEFYKGLFGDGESDESFNSKQESDSQRRDSFDSDFNDSDSEERRFRAGKQRDEVAEVDSEEERNLIKSERKEKKTVKFDPNATAKHKVKALQKQEETKTETERRKSNRLIGKTGPEPILKQPKPEKDAEAKKKRAKDKKVTFSGSMANPEFQEIFNTVGQEGVAEADKEALNEKPQASDWQTLLQKEKLTPLEMMQEAAFTELINKQSLE